MQEKARSQFQEGEAQLLGDANKVFSLRWGHAELSKPLSPRDERARSMPGVCSMASTSPGTGKGLGTASVGGLGLFPCILEHSQHWHPLAAIWQGFWCLTGCWLCADVVLAIHRAGYLQLPC